MSHDLTYSMQPPESGWHWVCSCGQHSRFFNGLEVCKGDAQAHVERAAMAHDFVITMPYAGTFRWECSCGDRDKRITYDRAEAVIWAGDHVIQMKGD